MFRWSPVRLFCMFIGLRSDVFCMFHWTPVHLVPLAHAKMIPVHLSIVLMDSLVMDEEPVNEWGVNIRTYYFLLGKYQVNEQ